MNCPKVTQQLEDYLDGALDEATRDSIRCHLEECPDCRERLSREQEFRDHLKSLPVPSPSPNFEERVFQRVHTPGYRSRSVPSALLKVAAGILVLIALGVMIKGVLSIGRPNSPKAHLTLNKQSEVNLVFSSKQKLENVTLTIQTPAGIEIPGFEDQRKISWETSLQKGKNVLELPVVARKKDGGTLIANVSSGEQKKQFSMLLEVKGNRDQSDAGGGSQGIGIDKGKPT